MIKSVTFAVMHFSIAFSVAWAITGDWAIGGAVALIEPAINSVGYVFHEKIWARYKRTGRIWGGASAPARPGIA